MIAQGFKPVGWVAAVAGAALGCYMLSLNVASERAELASLERKIIQAKQDIRTLQTELGTRGRLSQLEQWNAEVLALSAPTSAQFIENELVLARFDQRAKTIEDRSKDVQLASAATVAKPQARPALAVADFAAAAAAAEKTPLEKKSMVQRAALVVSQGEPAKADKPVKAAASAAPAAAPKPKKAAAPKVAETIDSDSQAGGAGGR